MPRQSGRAMRNTISPARLSFLKLLNMDVLCGDGIKMEIWTGCRAGKEIPWQGFRRRNKRMGRKEAA
jgi:hypothetical protein